MTIATATELTLPPIAVTARDFESLRRLADAGSDMFPAAADFLSREIERARLLQDDAPVTGLVMMGSTVAFRDDVTGQVRRVTLVYPDQADVSIGRISVLTPVGAALIGLSEGQAIEFRTPSGGVRSLTVLGVRPPHGAEPLVAASAPAEVAAGV